MGGSGSARNEVISNEIFVSLSRKYKVSVGVISLSWAVQRGISVIPKSSSIARLEQNIRLVKLADEDMEIMNEAHKQIGRTRLANVSDELNIAEEAGITKILGWTNAEIGWEDVHGNWLL
jgi:glycerol 2-dehydrogenase (NADP+)